MCHPRSAKHAYFDFPVFSPDREGIITLVQKNNPSLTRIGHIALTKVNIHDFWLTKRNQSDNLLKNLNFFSSAQHYAYMRNHMSQELHNGAARLAKLVDAQDLKS